MVVDNDNVNAVQRDARRRWLEIGNYPCYFRQARRGIVRHLVHRPRKSKKAVDRYFAAIDPGG
jgi:hypothetical protein